MATEETLYQERDGIAIISINRPEKKNTLTNSVIQGSRGRHRPGKPLQSRIRRRPARHWRYPDRRDTT